MSNLKTIAAIALLLALFACMVLVIPSLFVEEDNEETSGYSPISVNPPPENVSEPEQVSSPEELDSLSLTIDAIVNNIENLDVFFASEFTREEAEKMNDICGRAAVEAFAASLERGKVTDSEFKTATGYSPKAFYAVAISDPERTTVLKDSEDGVADFVFVGDTAFADGYSVMNRYKTRNKGIEGLVSKEVLDIMRSADVAMANHEFTLTDRGAPVKNKKWTFRGDPKNVSIFGELGVDIVGMANNHAFDYGPVSLTDTLIHLDGANIAHVGAGENLNDAKAPYYYVVNGYVVAIVAGSSIDRFSTRGATDFQSGVFQIFDTVSMTNEIAAAKKKADYVVAYVHWGVESTTNLTSGQKSMGKAFVDAGADVVIGMHSHCMQGLEYYKGKLIAYSLGNFVFSSHDLTCGMLKFSIDKDGNIKNVFYPMMQRDNFTYINSGENGKTQFESLRSLSINAEISDDYVVTESK
ncbi:MAG: CapA family protein [Clostridia bacterium]|nr:CapA family protein [Clostridia bacterium]